MSTRLFGLSVVLAIISLADCGCSGINPSGKTGIADGLQFLKASLFTGIHGQTKTGTRYTEFTYSAPSTLLNIDLIILVYYEDGQKSELRRKWSSWDKDETKRIDLTERNTEIQKCEILGVATFDGEKVGIHAEFPVSPIEFILAKAEGTSSHDIYLTYKGTVELSEVDALFVVWYENGKKPEVKRYWASLTPNEKKTISITSEGKIERVDLVGSALVNGKKTTFKHKSSW